MVGRNLQGPQVPSLFCGQFLPDLEQACAHITNQYLLAPFRTEDVVDDCHANSVVVLCTLLPHALVADAILSIAYLLSTSMDYGCQQNLLTLRQEATAVLEYLCQQSNKVYNCSLYYARQLFFKKKKLVKKAELCAEMAKSRNTHFKAMYVSSAQQTCNAVGEAVESFKKLRKLWLSQQLDQEPSFPKYRKQGLFTVSYPVRWLKLTERGVRLPLGNQVKAWFGLSEVYLPMPRNLAWENLKEVRILPRNGCFYAEYVYVSPALQPVVVNHDRALGIDHGINNWLTCVSNVGTGFIVDGRQLKSKNQWYNKRVAALKENQPQGFWSKQLASLTEKRNRQMRDAVNKVARLVVNHCVEHRIGTVVFGWN